MKNYLEEQLKKRLTELGWPVDDLQFSRPKKADNGDWSTNIAMALARVVRQAPLQIAHTMMDELSLDPEIVDRYDIVAPGFVNFFQSPDYLAHQIRQIVTQDTRYGRNNSGAGQKAQVEFVSANPTGPLTVGHGRQTVLGDTIANILDWSGYEVVREYYFNNAGRQMRKLGESLRARYLTLKGLPTELPEDGYQGEYLVDIARDLLDKQPDLTVDTELSVFKEYAEAGIFQIIKGTLARMGVTHDVFYNENTLYESGKVEEVLDELRRKDLVYEKDGATWFKTTALDFEQDRVLVKSTGEPTYRLPDMAYHREKFRRGFNFIVDVFGADHQDTYPDVLAALKVMGFDTSKVHVVIHQFVTLMRGDEVVKMSTRKAEFVTLDELLDEVGVDVVRYFYIMRGAGSHLNFDLDLAKRQTEENPVFYLQYAHARIASIFRKAEERGIEFDAHAGLKKLNEPETLALINELLTFPEVVERCLRTLAVHHLPNYLYSLATALHKFYTEHRVISDDVTLSQARLLLLKAVKIALRNGLQILGVTAPERM
ncbi:MAG: arginine--tRNA ligase [Candidatus Marinimicrobia bacterium]|nr:arginine--tRNA ligase [Candidatus Neomarinimicrobiota bacterium]MCF7901981.1 arginine--tRNA ligase [Candidatus Neomarinimicrobiota bacterium]